MRLSPTLSTLFALALTTNLATANSGQVVIPSSKDNSLFFDAGGTLAGGASDSIYVGKSGFMAAGQVKRGLVAFDVAGAIPAGATITNVSLTMRMIQQNGPATTIAMFRVTKDWGEGATVSFGGGGAPAIPGDATWVHTFTPGSTWTTAGGDFVGVGSAAILVGLQNYYTWTSAQLAVDVQDMLDNPGANYGWLFRDNETVSKTAKRFASKEFIVPADGPMLTIDYTYSPTAYCTSGTSANGCQAAMSASGTPSATAPTGFLLTATAAEGNKDGLFFFAANGRQANSWGNGTSFQCVAPPVFRGGLLNGTGTSGLCDGVFTQDMNARWTLKTAQNPGAGALVQAQCWYRDPTNTSNQTTSLSDAIEFLVCP